MKNRTNRRPTTRKIIVSATAATGIMVAHADAALYQYEVEGATVLAPDAADLGKTAYAKFVFDTDDLDTSSPPVTAVPILNFEYGIAGTTEVFTGTGGSIEFSDAFFQFSFSDFNAATYSSLGSFTPSGASFSLSVIGDVSPVVTAYLNSLPVAFDFSIWDTGNSFIVSEADVGVRIAMIKDGSVSITLSEITRTIPEPASAAMLGVGALAALRRRNRRREAVA